MATGQYGELALATLKELWCLVNKQFAKKYGPSPGRGAVLIGLGSLEGSGFILNRILI